MDSQPIEVAALGRPLYPGMLYDCRKHSFIPGVTLWDKKSLHEDLDTRTQLQTVVKFSSSDSISSKSKLLDVSASLKASFLGGLVEVGGSAKYLHDTKTSNQQSRVTMYYSATTRFDQLTMTHLSKITYPQVFDQKTATHVVTAVLYGAQAFMVFDRTFSEHDDEQKIEGELNVMVKKIPSFSIEGKGSVKMNEDEKKKAEIISCTFHGDFHLQQNPTTYTEALQVYQQLPKLLKDNPVNVIPIKVWLYPLHLLNDKAARLMREISTSLVSYTETVMEELGDAERRCNDLLSSTQFTVFSDIKERLSSFQSSFNIYKLFFPKALCKVLPAVRGGGKEEKSLEDILKIHNDSPFKGSLLNQWLHDTKSEIQLLSSYTKSLTGIRTVDSDDLKTILLNPDIDVVVCLTLTSLKYKDSYLSTLNDFVKSDEFKILVETKSLRSWASDQKWFSDPDVITKTRENLSLFKSYWEDKKDDDKMCFIISAISDPSVPGSSIYLYENGKLTNKQFQPLSSKPSPPIVRSVQANSVSLKLQKSPTGETVQYRVEYKEIKPEEEKWLAKNTSDEHFILTGLEFGKQYLIRYRIVGKMGLGKASNTVSIDLPSAPVTVGGKGGGEFSFIFDSRYVPNISISYDMSDHFSTIQMNFNTGQMMKVGKTKGSAEKEFVFEESDKITAATLWPNQKNTRVAGLELVVVKSNGEKVVHSAKCEQLGEPVSLDVKSGKFSGITGRSGSDVDALGFYFI